MRLALSAIAALLFMMTVPTDAPALSLRLGPISVPLDHALRRGVRKALRPYAYRAYRPHSRVARRPAARRAVAQALRPQAAERRPAAQQRRAAQLQMVQPEPFWPAAPQDVFEYVLSSKESGLWANGYGAIVVSMFAQPSRVADERGAPGLAAGDKAEQTTGAASTNGGEPVCGEHTASRAEAVTKQLRDTLPLVDDQKGALAELRSALLQADKETTAACPRGIPATLPDRLRAMQDRLWAMRAAATSLRAPLQRFHDALTNEQKAKLDTQQPAERGSKRRAPANEAAGLCQAMAQRAPQWPGGQIARAVRPDKDQQVSLGALSETSSQMSLLMMGSCPQKTPVTPLARLDVALDRLDTMLFGTVTMVVALDDFYRTLSDEQKAKLDTISL